MDNLIEELKKIIKFKDRTEVGDHVLIASKDPQVVLYALVNSIDRDTSRKDEWWHVGMHLLTLPPQTITWTLREEQFSGKIVFTINGVEHFITAVDLHAQVAKREQHKGMQSFFRKENEGKKNPFHIVK